MRRDLVSLTTSCLLALPRMIGLANSHRIMARTSQLRSRATKGEPPTGAGDISPSPSSELPARIGRTLTFSRRCASGTLYVCTGRPRRQA